MLNISDIKMGTAIKIDDNPYLVIVAQHLKMGRGGAILKTKLKNLINGNTLEKTFKGSQLIEEADLDHSKADFLYQENNDYYFMNQETFDQFFLPERELGNKIKFLKEGDTVDILYFEGKPVGINLPTKLKLKVTFAPPSVKGDTAQGNITQPVTLETGAVINAPLFVKEGDIIVVNTEREEYVERA